MEICQFCQSNALIMMKKLILFFAFVDKNTKNQEICQRLNPERRHSQEPSLA